MVHIFMADPEKSPGYSNRLKDDCMNYRQTALQGPGKAIIRRNQGSVPIKELAQYRY